MTTFVKNLESEVTPTDLHDQIATLQNDLSDLTQTIADLARIKGDDEVSTVKSRFYNASESVADQADTARLHALEVQGKAAAFIRA
ncbi:hypothetical protein OAH97_00865 [Octadecabacter sp.]|nr:hypothetical protein [Octadecabacter sp.]